MVSRISGAPKFLENYNLSLFTDPDYTGNVKAIIFNGTDVEVTLRKDCSYYQMVVPYYYDGFVLLDSTFEDAPEADSPLSRGRSMELSGDEELDEELEAVLAKDAEKKEEDERGEGAFGSTGSTDVSQQLSPSSPQN